MLDSRTAMNLQIPDDITEAVRIGLRGDRRRMDTGSVNGEHFMVMAGAGFDARMISEADRGLKDRLARAAYLYTGLKNLSARPARRKMRIKARPRSITICVPAKP